MGATSVTDATSLCVKPQGQGSRCRPTSWPTSPPQRARRGAGGAESPPHGCQGGSAEVWRTCCSRIPFLPWVQHVTCCTRQCRLGLGVLLRRQFRELVPGSHRQSSRQPFATAIWAPTPRAHGQQTASGSAPGAAPRRRSGTSGTPLAWEAEQGTSGYAAPRVPPPGGTRHRLHGAIPGPCSMLLLVACSSRGHRAPTRNIKVTRSGRRALCSCNLRRNIGYTSACRWTISRHAYRVDEVVRLKGSLCCAIVAWRSFRRCEVSGGT